MRTESRFGPVEVTSVQHPERFPENGGLATLGPGNEADRMTASGLGRCRRTTAPSRWTANWSSLYPVTLNSSSMPESLHPLRQCGGRQASLVEQACGATSTT
jgi:hypothetical protein